MDEEARLAHLIMGEVKILHEQPPILGLDSSLPDRMAPGADAAVLAPQNPSSPSMANDDSAWAAWAGATLILSPLLEDLAATHLSKAKHSKEMELKIRLNQRITDHDDQIEEDSKPGSPKRSPNQS